MSQRFQLFVLQSHPEASHTSLGHFTLKFDPSSASATVEFLEEAVRTHIKSRSEFRSWGEDIDNIIFEVYQVRQQHTFGESINRPFLQPSQELKQQDWMNKIKLKKLDQFKTVESNTILDTLEGPRAFVFVFGACFGRP